MILVSRFVIESPFRMNNIYASIVSTSILYSSVCSSIIYLANPPAGSVALLLSALTLAPPLLVLSLPPPVMSPVMPTTSCFP